MSVFDLPARRVGPEQPTLPLPRPRRPRRWTYAAVGALVAGAAAVPWLAVHLEKPARPVPPPPSLVVPVAPQTEAPPDLMVVEANIPDVPAHALERWDELVGRPQTAAPAARPNSGRVVISQPDAHDPRIRVSTGRPTGTRLGPDLPLTKIFRHPVYVTPVPPEDDHIELWQPTHYRLFLRDGRTFELSSRPDWSGPEVRLRLADGTLARVRAVDVDRARTRSHNAAIDRTRTG